uniref:Myelin basic protein n=1 Tax=Kryptolebias marmoratus TaxID=37003 RepID=A0A3Q3BJ50_KRYMA
MASASSSAQAAFGLGRRKKNPGLLDQIGKFFGGDKKRKGKGSFRGALSPAPQKASATSPRKRGGENAVVHFFRTIVSNAHSEPHLSNTHRLHTAEEPKCSGNVSARFSPSFFCCSFHVAFLLARQVTSSLPVCFQLFCRCPPPVPSLGATTSQARRPVQGTEKAP